MNQYTIATWLLDRAEESVSLLMSFNDDDHGLLKSARDHIVAARSDLEDDLK